MARIFEEVRLGELALKNRLVRSATWEGVATADGGIAPIAYDIYEELAEGGVGAIITGFTSVSDTEAYIEGPMRLSRDDLVAQHRRLTDAAHAHGVPIIAQLALGGHFSASGEPVEPNDMTEADIELVIKQFIAAAERADQAGYDGVQVHVAHFFFLSRFVSPAVNQRADEWGGSTTNRARIVCRIIAGIRQRVPKLHVTAKVNSSDFVDGGIDEAEALELVRLYEQAGLQSVEISGNGTSVAGVRPHRGEAYFVPFAAASAEALSIPVIAVGGLRSLDTMQEVLDRTGIQFLALSRPLLREPDLPERLANGETTASACISCNRCYNTPAHRCVFRRA